MVLEKLGDSLKNTLQKIAKAMFVDDKLINEMVKDLQRALLQADVNVKLVFALTSKIKQRIKDEEPKGGLTKKEQLINIVYEELVKFLGEEAKTVEIDKNKKPFTIMLVGLYASGKTTHAGKLGLFFKKRGYKVALLGLDVHRPAAMNQLEQVGKNVQVQTFTDRTTKNPQQIYQKYQKNLLEYDVVIIDTAGRDALSQDLVQEITALSSLIKPDERLLVISADIGQAAQQQAQSFHDSCNITGIIVTKMDGTAKAGGALSACAVTQAPIKFIGVGEHPDDLELFNPKGFVSRLLGMGDIEALIEKAKEAMTEEEAEDLGQKFMQGEFNLLDLYEQMSAMKKMGPLNKIMEMVPGLGQMKLPKEMIDVQQEKLEKWKYSMDSMTQEELEDPDTIDMHRIDRICKGSGISHSDIRSLIKQYRQSKKMMKMFKGKGVQDVKQMEKMMKRLGGKGFPGMKFG